MARMIITIQRKNTTIPGMAYPATVLVLATAVQLPTGRRLIRHRIYGVEKGDRQFRVFDMNVMAGARERGRRDTERS